MAPKTRSPEERLQAYRAKRSANRTLEPFGSPRVSRPRAFVVQKHSARRLHYDFRLELDGTLLSWAVPKGPSLDPKEKRLAVHVEDHPVEYADFEGVIADGNYGAGPVIVWDKGTWTPLEDPVAGMQKGKLLFELSGYKLSGVFTLVRTRGAEGKEWLLIKKPDAHAAPEGERMPPEESIFSGLRVEQLGEAQALKSGLRAALTRAGAVERGIDPGALRPMLAERADRPFSRPGWLFELKYDGFRLLASRTEGKPKLVYRSGAVADAIFPDLAAALTAFPYDAVLDGEVCVLDERGLPSFGRLQRRTQLVDPIEVQEAAARLPATYYAFDLLWLEGFDLRELPLLERKAFLRRILPPAGPLKYAEHFESNGEIVYEEALRLGFEGVVGKDGASIYREGRSPSWIKVRREHTGDFAIVGFTAPAGSRSGLGALHLAVYEYGRFVYAGRVGTGLADRELVATRAALDRLRVKKPPCEGPLPEGRGHTWVKPELVCEVAFHEWTREGLLRQPVFRRFRTDKAPEECFRPAPGPQEALPGTAAPGAQHGVTVSNAGKVFWPEDGITKGELVAYYRAIAPWLLPYLRDRPVVLTRFPDGIHGKSFFQKNAPGFVPPWLRTERMWNEDASAETVHIICEDEPSLAYVANLGTIPLHIWASRLASLQAPDWCILDLDPKDAPFADVIQVALHLRRICEQIELPCYVKTTGSTGLHVLIPLGGQCTYAEAKGLGELFARLIARDLPQIATVERVIPLRKGRVYVDYLQNGQGKLIAAPFCVRPLVGAPVSMPLAWSEVGPKLSNERFTVKNAVRRLERRGDPMRPVLTERPAIAAALERLMALLAHPRGKVARSTPKQPRRRG